MKTIQPTSFASEAPYKSVFDPPYENLMPIVETLTSRGNQLQEGGFVLTQGGWLCSFVEPLDFLFLTQEFEFPRSITVSEDSDSILDRFSWCIIHGPGLYRESFSSLTENRD
jgi:hypothetical protein